MEMDLLQVHMGIYHLKIHFKVVRHQMSHCYLSSKSKNNTRKWYFEYFIADYFPTLNKKDPVLIRTILVLNRTLFFRIVWTPLPTRRSSPSWKNSHRVILLWWWLTEIGPFEPLSVKCSQTHWWQCAGFTANMLVKDTLYLIRTIFCLSQESWKVNSHTSSRRYWKT